MRMLMRVWLVTVVALAALAAAASAAMISITLTPNAVKRHSRLSVTATGFPTATGVPSSAELQVQPGFKTSVKSVSRLCSPGGSSCPSESQIGSGTATLTATYLGITTPDTVNFTLYLGKPRHAGDIASVEVIGTDTALHATASGSGRLFKDSAGGLEVLFDQFPSVSGVPSGTSITLDSLSFHVGAHRTVTRHHKRVTYSLITNPSTCPGHWTGSATVTFASGPMTQSFSTPCKK